MEPAIVKAVEVGMHMVPVAFDSPLCPIFWGCQLAGVIIQLVLLKKGKRRGRRWAFTAVLLIGLLACEIACQVITGWDLILPLVLYFCLLTMLVGAGLCTLVFYLRKGKAGSAKR